MSVSQNIDRIEVVFDEPGLVANAGLVAVATLAVRLGLERLIDSTVRLTGRVGGAHPGRKVLTLVHALVAGGSHIDHADMLRAGDTRRILPFRVVAPSTVGTFLRSFTFGHVRQLDRVIAETLKRVWELGAGPGDGRLVMDLDSTITEVFGYQKQGAAYGYTKAKGSVTRWWLLVPTPARYSMPASGKGRAREASTGSLKNSSPGSDGPEPPARSWCEPTPGSGHEH